MQSEYRVGFTQCADCGVALLERLPLEACPHSSLRARRAETYANELEAAVARTALDAAGIDSMLRSDDSGASSACSFREGSRFSSCRPMRKMREAVLASEYDMPEAESDED